MEGLLILVVIGAIVFGVFRALVDSIFPVCSAFCAAFSWFWAKPPHIVFVGILAWTASIFLLLLWMSNKL